VTGGDDQRLHVAVAARELVGEEVELQAIAPYLPVLQDDQYVRES
jgi:hypothetical protein